MREDWEEIKMVDACEILTCGVASTPTYVDEKIGVPFLSAQNVRDGMVVLDKHNFISNEFHQKLTNKNKPSKGDILYSRVGAKYGEAGVFEHDFEFSVYVSVTLIRPKKQLLNNYFLKNYLNSPRIRDLAKKSISSSGVPNLNVNSVRNFPVPIPPIPEQQRIVAILDEAFAAIEKAKANAQQNLKNAKELFESYLQGVFENKGEDWEEKTLGEVCEISSKLIDPKKLEFNYMIHIGAGNIESQKGTLLNLKTAKEENLISGKFLFDESMILYSKIRPYLMKVVNCNFQGLCSADIYPLLPFKEKMSKDFLYHLLLTKDFTDYAILGSQRAGMPKVNREHLFAYKFYLPPLKVQQSVIQKLDALSAETKKLEANYQQKINDLEELKKSVLQKAFSGELNTVTALV